MGVIEHDSRADTPPGDNAGFEPQQGEPNPTLAGYLPLDEAPAFGTSLLSSSSSSSSTDSDLEDPTQGAPSEAGASSRNCHQLDQTADWDVDAMIRRQLDVVEGTSLRHGRCPNSDVLTSPVPDLSQANLWSEPVKQADRGITITSDKAAEIIACMSNFKLPPERTPPWALHVPEAAWKQELLQQLGIKESRFTSQ